MGCGLLTVAGGRSGYLWWQLRTARKALVLGQPAEAIEALTSAKAIDPAGAELQFLLAKAYRRSGDLDQAALCLEASLKAGWLPEQIREERYLTLLQSGRMEEAEPYLSRVLRTTTDDQQAYEVYEAIAKGHLRMFRFRDALLCLNHFIAWKPDAVQPRLWRAEVWKRQFLWDNARAEYQDIIQSHPSQVEARRGLAESLLQLNEIREAYEQFGICLETGSSQAETLLGAAKCEIQLGQPELAQDRFLHLVANSVHPGIRVEAFIGLGQIALHDQQYEEAVRVLRQALAIDPGEPAARFNLANALAKSGQLSEAEAEFEHAEIQKTRMSRFAEITRELFDTPQSAELRWEAGRILMDQGYQRDGAAWMATALEFQPDHQPTHRDLAQYYNDIDRPDLAAQHREMIRENQNNKAALGSGNFGES